MVPKLVVVALALTLLAAQAEAGVTFRQVSKTEGGSDAGVADATLQVWAEGDAMKLEFVEVAATPIFEKGSYMLAKGADLFLVNPAEETFTRLDLAALGDLLASAEQMMQQAGVEMTIDDPQVEKLLEEDGGTVAGYPAQHYRYRTTYTTTIKMPVGGAVATAHDILEDVWTTSAVDLEVDLRAMEMFSGSAIAGEVGELVEAERTKMTGFPLKRVMVQKQTSKGEGMMGRMMSRGGGGTTTTTVEAQDIRSEPIPASTFAIPDGYTEQELMQRGPAMPDLDEEEDDG